MAFFKLPDPLNEWTWCAGCVTGSLLIFISDMYTPPGFAHGGLYLLLVMMASASRSKRVVLGIATLSILLAITGAALDTPGNMIVTVVANRTSSVLAITIFTLTWITVQHQYTRLHSRSSRPDALALSLRQAADSASSLVWTANAAGRTDFVNAGLMRFFGLDSAAGFEGKSWPDILVPGQTATLQPSWEQCRVEGQPYRAEMKLQRHDGVPCRYLVEVAPVRDEQNIIRHWYGHAVNIDSLAQGSA